MSFLRAILTCLRKYVRFSGRAARAEYWNFVLFVVLVSTALNFLDRALFAGRVVIDINGVMIRTNGPLGSLFGVFVALPLLAAGWRRMHDTGRSGIYLFYPLIVMLGVSMFLAFLTGFGPLLSVDIQEIVGELGAIVALGSLFVLTVSPLIVVWWLTRPSQVGDNRFGPQPQMRKHLKP